MSRIVTISGAAGFVGRRLVTRLIELGYEVIALDLIDPADLHARRVDWKKIVIRHPTSEAVTKAIPQPPYHEL